MKLLRPAPIHALALFCLLAIVSCQLAWLRQLFWAEQARLQQEVENKVSTAAEQAIYTSMLRQPTIMGPYRTFFRSPGWWHLRAAFDNLEFPHLGKQFTSGTAGDSLHLLLRLTLHSSAVTGKGSSHYNSYVATETPHYLA